MLSISPDSRRAWRATAAIRFCSVGGTCIVDSGARLHRQRPFDRLDVQQHRRQRRAQLVGGDGQELVARGDRRLGRPHARGGHVLGVGRRRLAHAQPAIASPTVVDQRRHHHGLRHPARERPRAARRPSRGCEAAVDHQRDAAADDGGRQIREHERDDDRQREDPVEQRAVRAARQLRERAVEHGRQDRERVEDDAARRAARPSAARAIVTSTLPAHSIRTMSGPQLKCPSA